MPRTFGKLLCSIWEDPDFLALSSDAKVMYSAFISQDDISAAGVLPLVERRWRKYIDGDIGRVTTAIDELEDRGFVRVDDDTAEVWVKSFVEHDGRLNNSNLAKSIAPAIDQIRSDAIREACWERHGNALPTPSGRRSSPKSVDNSETPGETPFERPSNALRDEVELLKPQAASREPEACPSNPAAASHDLPAAAADAIEIYLTHRIGVSQTIDNPVRWLEKVRPQVADEYADQLAAFGDDTTARTIAMRVFKLTQEQAIRADMERQRQS